jgi:hypothetical protein
MKNNNFYKFGVVILLACIAFTSCKKDNMPQTEPTTDNTAYSKMIINQINKFKTQMQNPERSGEMLLDTAVWNLEALINYENAYPDSASKNFTIMSSHYTVTIDENGMVSETEVQQVYNLMLDTLDYQLSLLNDEVKFAVFSDVQLDEVDGNTAQLTVNNGYGSGFILGLYPPFDDNWVWGTLDNPDEPPYAGNCSQTDFSSDGSNEIEYRLNHPAAMPANVGYTDLVTLTADGWDFEDANGNSRIFIGWDYPNDECLTIDTLTYFLIEADDIIKTSVDDGGLRPTDKSFVRISILDELVMSSDYNWYIHQYWVTYGIPYNNIQH